MLTFEDIKGPTPENSELWSSLGCMDRELLRRSQDGKVFWVNLDSECEYL